jgi:hypothetical protein
MKIRIVYFMLFVFCTGFVSLFAQDNKEDMAAAQKIMMEYMTPGVYHERLAKSVGDWTAKMQFWTAPNGEPMLAEGSVKAEMILGGRYLQMKYTSSFMGMPYEGISTDGYDNGKKVFFNTWVDNMGTGIMYSVGKYDDQTKQIVYAGNMYDPTLGKEVPYRQIVQMVDDTHMVMEMFYPNPKDGKEFKAMHVDYVKK